MIKNILFGKMKTFQVNNTGITRIISGRYYRMDKDGYLNIYDAWWVKIATIRDVQSIIEVEV
jgi:hypothetical protein